MAENARTALAIVFIMLTAVPVAGIATVFLTPLWRWIEATTGLESIGHSGPAGWCYVLSFGVVVALGCAISFRSPKVHDSNPR